MLADSVSVTRAAWSYVVLLVGMTCLVPAALITFAFYGHVWHYQDIAAMAVMAPVYMSLLAGPFFMLAGGSLQLRRTDSEGTARSLALVGAVVTILWCLFALSRRPPDAPVRAAVAIMATLSLAVGVWTVVLVRRKPAE